MDSPAAPLIAFVDDEEGLRSTVALALRKEGYRAETFADGLEAWTSFQRALPDLAILDKPDVIPVVSDPGVVPTPGLPVCHFGVVTGESCGNIQAVYNGWFTMANGVVSQKGDSGGPVYFITPDGRAAMIGMFNSTWGQFPAAVSWHVANQQASQDVISAASAPVP